jgi:ketosteroid isomerase-like protein
MVIQIPVLAMFCMLSPLLWAQDGTNQAAASKILALESVWNQAEENGDIGSLDLIFDSALIYIDEDGSLLTKTQFLGRAQSAGAHVQTLATQTTSVQVYGETAVVVGSYRARGVDRGKPYQREGRFIDTWVFKKGAWVCIVAQATPILR